jgi:hypothetical protein
VGLAQFEVGEDEELIEVRAADDLLLATQLLSHDDWPEEGGVLRNSVTIERGQQLSFAISPVKDVDGEITGATINLSYRETRSLSALALFLRRIGYVAGEFSNRRIIFQWKPALAVAALLLVTLGFMVYWFGPRRSQNQQTARGTPPSQKTPQKITPSPATAAPPTGSDKREKRERPRPAPPDTAPTPESPDFANTPSDRPQRNEQEPNPDVSGDRSGSNNAFDAVALLAVKKAYVDPFGDDPTGRQFRDQLIAALRANRRFVIINDRNDADAVLKGRLSVIRGEQLSLTVRLVNANGQVIWPVKGSGAGKTYQGTVASVAGQIARDLLADIDRAERK